MDDIKILPNLDIKWTDLVLPVDKTHFFTLRDVMRAIMHSSEIPVTRMEEILVCPMLDEMWKEIIDNEPAPDGDMEYLELRWSGEKRDGECFSRWDFLGIGQKGKFSDDIKDFLKNPSEYRERYSLEFSQLYCFADLPIRFYDKMTIDHEYPASVEEIAFTPDISLLELLYSIVWELSFFGSIAKREECKKTLESRCKQIEDAKKNGTLDQIMIPWEDVKKRIQEKFGTDAIDPKPQ